MATSENRQFPRIGFYEGLNVRIVAIDGAWTSPCKMTDVSLRGCKLVVESAHDIKDRQFYLVLSATGDVYRRCKRIWAKGEQLGVRFVNEIVGSETAQRDKAVNN